MKRWAILAACIAGALAVLSLGAGSARAGAGVHSRVVPTPCPSPQPTPTATPVYGGPPPHTTYKFPAFCGPTPPGPFPPPRICGLKFSGTAAPYSVVYCAPTPPPLCGQRTAKAVRVTGTDLNLMVPGYKIFEETTSGTFFEVSSITGNGGTYEFISGGSPVFLVGTGTCVPIPPLPVTGAALPPSPGGPSPWLWSAALAVLLVGAAGVITYRVSHPKAVVNATERDV